MTGIDASLHMIDAARARATREGADISSVPGHVGQSRKSRCSSARRVAVGPRGKSLAQSTRQDLQRIATRKAAAPGKQQFAVRPAPGEGDCGR